MAVVVEAESLGYSYAEREALRDVSFAVERGEMFGLLGPNGSGKTTLFRILSTLLPPSAGRARIFGLDLAGEIGAVRARIGVVFQHPSVDGKLRVGENLRHHGHLHGLSGADLERRLAACLDQVGLTERMRDRVDRLSGGLQRRVELAKALLHQPDVLLLDEPSTGLDPTARRDLTRHLADLCAAARVTVLMTTHMMEEADRCGRVAILDQGHLVRIGRPDALKAALGGDVIVIETRDPQTLRARIEERFDCAAAMVDGVLRIERPRAHEMVPALVEAFPEGIDSITCGRPTLEDVFVHFTGHRFEANGEGGTRHGG